MFFCLIFYKYKGLQIVSFMVYYGKQNIKKGINMFKTQEIETEVIDTLKHIVGDNISEVNKRFKTVEFIDGSIYYILTDGQQ